MYTIKNTQTSITASTLVQAIFALNERWIENDLIKFRTKDPLHIEAYDGRHWPVAFQSGGYVGYPLLHDDMPALEWLDRMLIEVRLKTIDPNGFVLPPQRMPRSVWNGLQSLLNLVQGYGELFSKPQCKQRWEVNGQTVDSLLQAYTLKFKNYFGYGPTGPERGLMQSANHEWYVAHALLRGEDLPQSILDDYASIDWVRTCQHRDVDWIEYLLHAPYLRGRFARGQHLRFCMGIAGKPDCSYKEVTRENVGYLAGLLKSLPDEAGWIEMDDLFYAKGILRVLPLVATSLPSFEDGAPLDDLAKAVHEEIVKRQRARSRAYLDDRIKQGISQREIAREQQRIDNMEREHTFAHPNRVSRAVADRDMHFLVEILDSSSNVGTQRAVKRVRGIEIERLPSAKRMRAIFRLAGYEDDAQYAQARAQYDTEVATAKAIKQAQQAVKDAERQRETLTRSMNSTLIKFNEEVMTMAAFIQKAIADGHKRVTKQLRGAVPRYYLVNEVGSGYLLDSKNGSLDYARMLLEQADSEQPDTAK